VTFVGLPLPAVLGLLFGAFGAVIALHLLLNAKRPQTVSSLDFWRRALESKQAQWLFAHRLPWVALLLSCLIAVLLVLELGDPRFDADIDGTTVVVVSADRTMGTTHAGESRTDMAFEQARELARDATVSGKVTLVRAGVRPSVVVPLTRNANDVANVRPALAHEDGKANLGAAISLGRQIVEHQGGNGSVLVLSDAVLPEDTQSGGRVQVERIPVGVSADSLAIVAFGTRRDPMDLGEYAVHCEVEAFTSRPASARLVIRQGETVVAEQPMDFSPGDTVVHSSSGFSRSGGELVATLEDINIESDVDALASDDVAYAFVPPLAELHVLLVSAGNEPLERVLTVNPSVRLERAAPGAIPSEGSFDVVVLDRTVADALPPARGYLRIGPEFGVGDRLRSPAISGIRASHPVMRRTPMQHVQVKRARALKLEPGAVAIMRTGDHALITAADDLSTRTLTIGFSLDQSDLDQRIAFPLVMHNALQWLAGNDRLAHSSTAPGEHVVVAQNAVVEQPGGQHTRPQDGLLVDTLLQGIYRAGLPEGEATEDSAGASTVFAVDASATAANLVVVSARRDGGEPSPWPSLQVLVALLLLLLLITEWALLHRRLLP
jgi:hypothetical protein